MFIVHSMHIATDDIERITIILSDDTDVIIPIQVISGCDYTSKVHTNAAARKGNIQLIKDFSTILDLEKAEEYVPQVMKLGTYCKTMDSLRYL
jgi:hypothetical protein